MDYFDLISSRSTLPKDLSPSSVPLPTAIEASPILPTSKLTSRRTTVSSRLSPSNLDADGCTSASRYNCTHRVCMAGPLANRCFGTWSALQKHHKFVHPPICPYPECDNKRFTTARGLRLHLIIHDETNGSKEKGKKRMRGRGNPKSKRKEEIIIETETEAEAGAVGKAVWEEADEDALGNRISGGGLVRLTFDSNGRKTYYRESTPEEDETEVEVAFSDLEIGAQKRVKVEDGAVSRLFLSLLPSLTLVYSPRQSHRPAPSTSSHFPSSRRGTTLLSSSTPPSPSSPNHSPSSDLPSTLSSPRSPDTVTDPPRIPPTQRPLERSPVPSLASSPSPTEYPAKRTTNQISTPSTLREHSSSMRLRESRIVLFVSRGFMIWNDISGVRMERESIRSCWRFGSSGIRRRSR